MVRSPTTPSMGPGLTPFCMSRRCSSSTSASLLPPPAPTEALSDAAGASASHLPQEHLRGAAEVLGVSRPLTIPQIEVSGRIGPTADFEADDTAFAVERVRRLAAGWIIAMMDNRLAVSPRQVAAELGDAQRVVHAIATFHRDDLIAGARRDRMAGVVEAAANAHHARVGDPRHVDASADRRLHLRCRPAGKGVGVPHLFEVTQPFAHKQTLLWPIVSDDELRSRESCSSFGLARIPTLRSHRWRLPARGGVLNGQHVFCQRRSVLVHLAAVVFGLLAISLGCGCQNKPPEATPEKVLDTLRQHHTTFKQLGDVLFDAETALREKNAFPATLADDPQEDRGRRPRSSA